MGEWCVSAQQMAKLMGPGATDADAADMADLLTSKGYLTRLGEDHVQPGEMLPVAEAVWEDSLMSLVALRAH